MKRKSLIIVFSIIVILMIIVIKVINSVPAMAPVTAVTEIKSSDKNSSLFFKSISWGMTYDKKLITLSVNDKVSFEPDSTREYVFKGSSFLFYKTSGDSLYIYTAKKTGVPSLFASKIKILQIELDNPSMMKLKGYEAYKKTGLSEFK